MSDSSVCTAALGSWPPSSAKTGGWELVTGTGQAEAGTNKGAQHGGLRGLVRPLTHNVKRV